MRHDVCHKHPGRAYIYIQIANAAAPRKRKSPENLHRVRDLRETARLDEPIPHCMRQHRGVQ